MKSLQEVYIFFRISNSLHYVKGLNLWVHFKSSLILIVRVNVVLNRTVVVNSDWRFDNLCGSQLMVLYSGYWSDWSSTSQCYFVVCHYRPPLPPPPTILPTLLLLSLFPIELVAKSVFFGDPFQAVYTRNSAVSFTSLFLSFFTGQGWLRSIRRAREISYQTSRIYKLTKTWRF